MDGVSGHSEPSVVNHSDHSAGSEMPLRGCGRAHRSPSSASQKRLCWGQTLLPQTRLFSWLDSARLDSSSCHRVRTRVHGPSVLGGPLACGDRFATCVTSRSRRNFRRPPRSLALHHHRLGHFQGLALGVALAAHLALGWTAERSVWTCVPIQYWDTVQPQRESGRGGEQRPAYAHRCGSMHQRQILLKRGMAHHARARAQSHTRPCPLAPPVGQHTGFSPSNSLRERPRLAWQLSIP